MSEEKKKRTGSSRGDAAGTEGGEKTSSTKKKKTTCETQEETTSEPKSSARAKGTGSKTKAVPPSEPEEKKQEERHEPNPSSVGNQLAMLILLVVSVFIGICYAFRDDVGIIGYAINYCLFGLFGVAAFLVPFLLLQLALFWRRDVLSGGVRYKYLVAIFVLISFSVMVHTIHCMVTDAPKMAVAGVFTWTNIKAFFINGVNYRGGGFFGGFLASALICAVGYPGTILFNLLFLVGFVMTLFGLTPIECMQRMRFYYKRSQHLQQERKSAKEAERETYEKQQAEEAAREERAARRAAAASKKASASEKKTMSDVKNRADNIDHDIFAEDASFGNDSESDLFAEDNNPKVKKKKNVIKEEKLRPIGVIESEEETVSLHTIFDQKTDEAVVSRYAETSAENDQDEAHIELASEKDMGQPATTFEETESEFFVPVKRTKTKPAVQAIAPPSEPKKAYEPIYKNAPATESEAPDSISKEEIAPPVQSEIKREESKATTPAPVKEESVSEQTPAGESEQTETQSSSDVISIRPPEMSVPAPDTESDEDEYEEIKPREYEFPPIELLAEPPADRRDGDVSAELRENADRIIQTLDSFNVRVSISNVSRGPTITRYEVEPSPGTRVRSIINLLDDIALSLATSGVRSDGIISGKSAIGIEVPNKNTNTVYVRELIEDSRFEAAKSKLTASLGMDVSGAPVYLDIAKMPHLLIAGATGQGKSVCINSLIISLLYKARPDEVKLILIDPKKVELNVYNGLPHLLVPVVFDPKKAAGSLHWAVQEMERRFELIEAQHVRNIAQYNAAIADDPRKEKLPQVVIIIDELADLMMSAPDDVETSICRLAQKARAAGMHLIIGTQRPSTDVITGLIKANIPSRIAFTVSNQIDSRIIIDTQGAEKLIGKGDMLYSPVGSSKPIRVQGSFVSEKEIEDIIDFIKAQSTGEAYSDDVIKEIEKNAAACGQKKGKGAPILGSPEAQAEEAEEADPMLDAAIELAVESGKISTSLIQRRLSLGYGRAAKLIDVMEKRGIVSPPEGQKPRTVLISREQYLEMRMNHIDSEPSADADDEPPFDV